MKAMLDIGVLLVTVLMMVTVGMDLEARHFLALARRKGALALIFFLQALLLPAVGFALVRGMGLPPHVSAGILLLAACPVGDIANVYTLLGRGNVAMSVSLNAGSCLLSVITMALTFAAYTHLLHEPFLLAVPPPTLIVRLLLLVVLPILAGMGLRRFRPGWVDRHRKGAHGLTLAGIAVVLFYVLGTRWEQVTQEWRTAAAAATAFMALAMGLGLLTGRLLRLPPEERFTVGVVFAVRNVGLSFAIAVTLLNRLDYAVFSALYFAAEIPLVLGAVAAHRFMSSQTRGPSLILNAAKQTSHE